MLFSSRKPLYFVFHDRSERYFQDSTLQLTFSEWLWLTLRKGAIRIFTLWIWMSPAARY